MSHSWVIQNEFEASSQQTVSLGSLVRPQLSIASSWPLHLRVVHHGPTPYRQGLRCSDTVA